MSFGPNPWQQTSWDWRAAGNFIGGGAGTGLIMFTALSGVQGTVAAVLLLAGLALVGSGSPASGRNSGGRCARCMCSSTRAHRG
jgi:hypothetical protein